MGFGAAEVGTRVGLAYVCCERAAFLTVRIEAKLIVAGNICPEFGVVLERGEIDGCAYSELLAQLIWMFNPKDMRMIKEIYVPLFHRPTRRAPSRSAPSF